uniref:Centrosomal protein 192 n=1 Tax=Echeneis naucrates TaxID=173247 RepID=A0A665TA93_ECHNA
MSCLSLFSQAQNNCTMALSTTIIRFSPTPPVEPEGQSNLDIPCLPKSLDQVQPQQSRSLDPLPVPECKNPEVSRSCSRSQSECNYNCRGTDLLAGCQTHKQLSESNVRQLTKVDSGYCSNLNIQQTRSSTAPQSTQQWGAAGSGSSSVYAGGLAMPPSYSSEELCYVPFPSFKPQCAGLIDLPHKGDVQTLLSGCSIYNSQISQQYLGSEAPLHPGTYHVGTTGNGLYTVSTTAIMITFFVSLAIFPIFSSAQWSNIFPVFHILLSSSGQVVVPGELRFPHACCVGIASQTSISLFNPSERWQQVSINVVSVAINGEKVDSLPYQWLIVKNKTIIAPKTTEEQKVLFIPPQSGVYQCVLSVCSWPASAETEVAARANIFAKRVVLVAIAENPVLEVGASKSGYLDFGDLPGGSAKSLPLKLLNRTHTIVPIRLVISANATAWRCFTLSKHPCIMTSEATQQAGQMTPMSSPSVINHVMHPSYGENLVSFMVWVHFKAPQKYSFSGELGPPDEYVARVDIELDTPGPSHVIWSIPLSARSGTARVHAPKDLQVVKLPYGVFIYLFIFKSEGDSFSVTPDELCLKRGEEQEIIVSFKAQGNRKCKESLLTILVLPSGPQYEVTLKGEAFPEDSEKIAVPSAAVLGTGLAKDIPPILSNKQFIAWGGVTLGRAVQQKLVLRNNSTSTTQQLRLLIRGQDQDCFQLQSMFTPEERLTRHGELSIRPREDVTVHLLFAPTRVASMLAKLEIKQSGVRPSQPGVKFTIPLSGYGGTSNIILEDQRKRADSYVAILTDIAVGHVSKICLCVRNTGSRAAFIKAVAYSDVQARSVLDPSVISLAPSQFVLKERTQEAHIFYGNMSKVVVSLLGSTTNMDSEGKDHTELELPRARHGSETDRYQPRYHQVKCNILEPGSYGAATTSQVQIRNNTPRELSFDLSWPAHCLTITPQHGVIEPQCHLQILVSPNPSLANKSTPLPWSGQVYVQCDGQQKCIKVQIRQDLALDVSTAPADRTLSALPPLAATPVLPMGRLTTKPSLSFCGPLVSGTLGAHEKMQVGVTFLPRDRGDYAQFWDLECHPVSEPQEKTRIRFQLCGRQEGDHSLVKTEATVKTRKRSEATTSKSSQEEAVQRGVHTPKDLYTFPTTRVGESSSLKVSIRNNSSNTHELKFVNCKEPFHIKHSKYSLRSQHYLKLPVQFRPCTAGRHAGLLLIQSETSGNLVIQLIGEALP